MAGRPNRPKQTPAETGRRANVDIGGIAGAAGAGNLAPTATPGVAEGPNQGTGEGTVSPPMALKEPSVFQNILTRGGASQQYNSYLAARGLQGQSQDFSAQQANLSRDFELKKIGIEHDNRLDENQKQAELQRITQDHVLNSALLTQNGVIANPENQQEYDTKVSPLAIESSATGQAGRLLENKNAAQRAMAVSEGQTKSYPQMVDTTSNQNRLTSLATSGAVAAQPFANKNLMLEQELKPIELKSQAAKAPLLPVTSSYFNVLGGATPPKPAASQIMGAVLPSIMQSLGGQNSPFGNNAKFIPQPQGVSPQQNNGKGLQQNGNFIMDDGTTLLPDGTKLKPGQQQQGVTPIATQVPTF